MLQIRSIFIFFFSLGIASCATSPTRPSAEKAKSSTGRLIAASLSEAEAKKRAAHIGDVRYEMNFDLTKEKELVGTTTIQFTLRSTDFGLTVDLMEAQIQGITLNGQPLKQFEYNNYFITLPANGLKEGDNTVTIQYTAKFSNSGPGLNRFVDPVDKKVYTYTHFEPYYANKMFPCFDQPDLKGTYKLSVLAPQDWTVVTATRETKTENRGSAKFWIFAESDKFSTYLISLHGGPYKIWSAKAGKIPMRLLARESVAKYVDANEWFDTTRRGLQYFPSYFGVEYPFKKYDQVLVPEFFFGAMENVGAVVFNEQRFVSRGKRTQEQKERLASTILHEMAHMWFGNLVTMRWWNDLWLNESFATYMASRALVEATPYKKAWDSFYQGEKQWAYWSDQLVTSHPIEASVPDTSAAFSNFDGITYGKGASVLKQLAYYVGPHGFRTGVKNYFQKNAFKNAELKDFVGSLQEASGVDLNGWTEQWLRTAGTNTLEARYYCDKNQVRSFDLIQGAPKEWPTLRNHKTEVGFYRIKNGQMELYDTRGVSYSAAKTSVNDFIGQACPDLVIPNYQDYDFVRVKMDSKSLLTAQEYINHIAEPLTRMMVWQSLWDMVREGELASTTYTDFALKNIGHEGNIKVLHQVFGTLHPNRFQGPAVATYLPSTTPATQKAREVFLNRIEKFFAEGIKKAPAGSDIQRAWYNGVVQTTYSAEGQARLLSWLDGKDTPKGLTISQDERWGMIKKLNELGHAQGDSLRTQEAKRDPSRRGILAAIEAEAVKPDPAIKKLWLERAFVPAKKVNFSDLKTASRNLFPPHQEALKLQFDDFIYQNLLAAVTTDDPEFQDVISEELAPSICDERSAESLKKFIAANEEKLPTIARKNLLVAQQESARCVAARKTTMKAIEGRTPAHE